MVFSAVHVMLLSRTTGPPSQTMLERAQSSCDVSVTDTSVPVGNALNTCSSSLPSEKASGVTPVAVKANFWPLDCGCTILRIVKDPSRSLLYVQVAVSPGLTVTLASPVLGVVVSLWAPSQVMSSRLHPAVVCSSIVYSVPPAAGSTTSVRLRSPCGSPGASVNV